MKRVPVALAALAFSAAATALSAQQPPKAVPASAPRPAVSHAPATPPVAAHNETLKTYCAGCHNDRVKSGDLSLASFDAATAADHAEVAEKIVRKLRTGMMPPRGASRKLDPATREALASSLETTLDRAAAVQRNPGRRSFQRLNRAEYVAAVRALFGFDIDVTSYLPADTISASFDNIADVQMPSATVMQGYMRAAAYVSRVAVGDPAVDASSTQYEVPRTLSQKERLEGAPFGTRGGTVVTHNFPADGKYKFQMLLHGEPTGYLFGRTQRNIEMEVAVDGERVALVKVDRWMSESDPEGLTLSTAPIYVRAGARKVSATFIQEFEGAEDDLIKPIEHTLADTQIGVGYGVTTLAHLRNLSVVGPYEATGVSDHPARRAIFSCRPTAPGEDVACARSILQRLATQAYRRPASKADIDQLMAFYEQAAKTDGFEGGVRQALQALLSSLHFVFRVEETPAGVKPGAAYRITDLDLASRLSFFLWGTLPDKELLDVAARGGLTRPEMSERQVRRMLEDPKAEALGTRFAAQWLRLQDLTKVEPDALSFPYFDESLADAMARETELLFDHLVKADRSALELLTADYTFVNERLARHYGIPGVSGPTFRKVAYPDETRRGLLGHGSVLTLTSHGNRTSPVLRGKWVMEVLLGSPPPPPPPNVPELEATKATESGRLLSVAEQLAQHRASPVCSSCHNVIDPIGLSLDNFDVTGAWRIKDRGVPVNASGQLYDGTTLNGVADLRAALVARSDVFITHLTERMLSYALGRRVEYYDMPTVRQIVKDAKANDYRMSSLILGVVKSAAFRTASADRADETQPQ
jgi:mono/diheme cytochrome c family protein